MPSLAPTKRKREWRRERVKFRWTLSQTPLLSLRLSFSSHQLKYQICFISDNLKIFEVNQTPPSIAQNWTLLILLRTVICSRHLQLGRDSSGCSTSCDFTLVSTFSCSPFPQREKLKMSFNFVGRKTTKGRHFQYFSSAIGCSAISCLSSTIVYILSICQSTRPPVYLQFVWIPRILQLYRTCYFLASTTQQINLYPWIIFTNCVFCRLFQSVWMLSTFKSSQKTAEQCKTFFLN